MMTYLVVGLGGAIGSMTRHWLSGVIAASAGEAFPWGTVTVNVTGCFLIGVVATLTAPDGQLVASATVRQFMMVGILGGYTTFSAFSLQTVTLMQAGQWLAAGANIGASVVLCLMATWLGHLAALALSTLR